MHLLNQVRYTGLAVAIAALGLGSLMWPGTSTAEVETTGSALVAAAEDPTRWCASLHEDETVEEASLEAESLESDGTAQPEQCFWDGTAPFCEGRCPVGYKVVQMSECGDGRCCWTGWKVLCCPA
jgi:hypothetical protein